MNHLLDNHYIQRIELAVWDMAIAGMTHSRLVQQTIRGGAQLSKQMDWKKDPKIIGLVASGGLFFGSGLSMITFLLH